MVATGRFRSEEDNMNRRSLLALLGSATLTPSVSVKAAAEALGVSEAMSLSSGLGNVEVAGIAPGSHGSWWGSPMQIMLDARERTQHEMANAKPYPHMKSWGHGFRSMVAQRDNLIMMAYRQKMQEDMEFRERVFRQLGVL
ncbi:hypothetical protein Pan1_89 [Pseudanabaena phage Pan1]|nr:hypothetical protein Pan1_89 [Pseudanabaena phage Pan1]